MDGTQKQKHDLQMTISVLADKVDELTAANATAHEKAIESENKFKKVVTHAPVGITILQGGTLVAEMANQAYLNIIDRTEEQFVGKPLFESLPEVKDAVWPIFQEIFKTGKPFYGYEFEVPLKRGGVYETTYFNFVYHPVMEEGRVESVIVVANDITAQVLTKKALAQRENQFRDIVMRSPIAMTIFKGTDFVIEMANETLLKGLWGRSLEEVQGKKLLDVFPELKDQKFPELLNGVINTGQPHQEKEALAWINAPGRGLGKHYLDFEYAPLLESNGQVSGVFVTVYDVTEKVLARQASEVAEKRYRELIDNLPAAVYTIDAEGYVNLYNQEAAALWGRKPVIGEEQWCGAHQLFELDGAEIALKDCAMAKALQQNKSIHAEVYIVRPDGTKRHVVANPRPIQDAEGNPIGALNIIIDITDRIESEKALRNSEQKFRMLANAMPQMIWTANPNGVLNYFSESVFDYSGITEERIFNEGWMQIVHPDDRKKNLELWQKSVATGKDFHYEHRFRRHDGEYRWQLSRAVPQKDERGNITFWVGTSTDIHDRKLFGDELARKVEERTEELRLKNEALLKSNSELVQFTYVASHDLQEPLRKIQTFVSRILDGEAKNLSEKGADYFGRIEKSSARMQMLIHDLLEFSRTNTSDKHFEQTDLNQVLGKVAEDLSELIAEKGATINWSALPQLPLISFQIEQLFGNLISNSIKFAKPDEKPVVNITCEKVNWNEVPATALDVAPSYYHITVADNGIGFKPEYSERIFMLFQRLHGRDAYHGTGIGLAICKKIMDNHNGFIAATSELGQGATFHVYLPIKRQ